MLVVVLAACGDAGSVDDGRAGTGATPGPAGTGGAAGVGGTDIAAPVVGALLAGGPVAGVTYSTDTQSGVTDEDGSFAYIPGEHVTFELGNTVLGAADGDSVVSPFDLAGIEPPIGTVALRERFADAQKFSAFHRAANIATLLQSMDQDIDPTNGIEITDAVRERMMDVSLDLDGDFMELRENPTLNRVLFAIVQSDLFSEPHGVRNPLYALQLVYDALGIDPEVLAPVAMIGSDSASRLEYNEWGQKVSSRTASAIDVGDSLLVSTYDDNGNVLTRESTGSLFYSEIENTYDVLGRRVTEENDDGFNRSVTRHEYDEAGLVVKTTRDRGKNGSVDSATTFEYDDRDRLVRTVVDEPPGGPIERVITEGYDENGRHVFSKIDDEGDRLVDEKMEATYDGQGRRASEAKITYFHFIIDLRGGQILETVETVEEVERWTYSDAGLVTEHTRSENFEDPPVYRERRFYDDRNRVIETLTADLGFRNERVEFDYNEMDLITEERRDYHDNGTFDRTIRYEYDAAGNEIGRTILDTTRSLVRESINEPTGLAGAL